MPVQEIDISNKVIWGAYPKTFRRRWRAQYGVCYLCGKRLSTDILRPSRDLATTREHVIPKIALRKMYPPKLQSTQAEKYILLAHNKCNNRKGERMPFACELLFLSITNEILSQQKVCVT